MNKAEARDLLNAIYNNLVAVIGLDTKDLTPTSEWRLVPSLANWNSSVIAGMFISLQSSPEDCAIRAETEFILSVSGAAGMTGPLPSSSSKSSELRFFETVLSAPGRKRILLPSYRASPAHA